MEFVISASTDTGLKKHVNQDSLFVRKLQTPTGKMVFAVLCDGMGGLKRGEVASATVLEAFSQWMYTQFSELSRAPIEDRRIKTQWCSIITEQNDKLQAYGRQQGVSLGTTVTAALITPYRYYILNVGDTRCYEITDHLHQVTIDHTVIAKEIRRGNLTVEQAEEAPVKHMLTRCIGVTATVVPDLFFGETQRNAVYMLCSDGFRHKITVSELVEGLGPQKDMTAAGMHAREETLIERNKQRGETDNISVITIATC